MYDNICSHAEIRKILVLTKALQMSTTKNFLEIRKIVSTFKLKKCLYWSYDIQDFLGLSQY